MASGTLGLPNRLNPFLPIHDLFSAAQIDKLNSIVDRKFWSRFIDSWFPGSPRKTHIWTHFLELNKMEPMMFHNLPHKREVSEMDSLDDESDLNDFMKVRVQSQNPFIQNQESISNSYTGPYVYFICKSPTSYKLGQSVFPVCIWCHTRDPGFWRRVWAFDDACFKQHES